MTEAELEKKAAETRDRLLTIWEGDAERSDEWICFLMRYLKDAWAQLPPDQQNPAMEAKILQRMMLLVQR